MLVSSTAKGDHRDQRRVAEHYDGSAAAISAINENFSETENFV
jgi:hypothetical protein